MINIRIICMLLLITALSYHPPAFSAQFNFTPRSSAEVEYTDNVDLTEDDKEDDFITTVSAGFTAQLLGKTSGLELSFDPAYVFYEDFTGNDGWRLPAAKPSSRRPTPAGQGPIFRGINR